ncbi:hypothetical protein H6A60_01180 [Sutterella massiliensis]|uniref:Uncharacterized protein n=1 Tax=Sutterella massiliensis TaxID=1816689 RepID=A0ABS2DP35_9BURK|nr:hypothetical protein [Sutterella massiliensis]MBM6703128.1 hypothetical protein [Sutterella massiliensis]
MASSMMFQAPGWAMRRMSDMRQKSPNDRATAVRIEFRRIGGHCIEPTERKKTIFRDLFQDVKAIAIGLVP